MNVIKPPEQLPILISPPELFIAGSIEQGTAWDWQSYVIGYYADHTGTIYNPRRDNWDPTWPQDPEFPEFREQVEWELNALVRADTVLMYFDPDTKSPITLLELGLFANSQKLHVACPRDYWRYGNVAIVCEHCKIPLHASLDEMLEMTDVYV